MTVIRSEVWRTRVRRCNIKSDKRTCIKQTFLVSASPDVLPCQPYISSLEPPVPRAGPQAAGPRAAGPSSRRSLGPVLEPPVSRATGPSGRTSSRRSVEPPVPRSAGPSSRRSLGPLVLGPLVLEPPVPRAGPRAAGPSG
ncbi:hypothetical protein EYF80_042759 [Liparis tanakae]|uniref:Uncharacterized protein n=1 Tax=Liparis tanakae TaxID=230148 RepID=A0A4Z2G0E1_9TELE|nr:hypothetical protein EYF80_042759 [Liparis tanakae]